MPRSGLRELALRTTGITYPGSPDQIGVVRADLRVLLEGCPMADDVILSASELATNAMLHSNSGLPGETFVVWVCVKHGDYVWMEVEDRGGGWNPPDKERDHGHGLDIVDAVASDWGVDGDYHRRTVWARFDWPEP